MASIGGIWLIIALLLSFGFYLRAIIRKTPEERKEIVEREEKGLTDDFDTSYVIGRWLSIMIGTFAGVVAIVKYAQSLIHEMGFSRGEEVATLIVLAIVSSIAIYRLLERNLP